MRENLAAPDAPARAESPTGGLAASARLSGRPVLLATDASVAAGAAARVTAALAECFGALPQAVRVIELATYPVLTPFSPVASATLASAGPPLTASDEQAVRAELGKLFGTEVEWPVRLTLGDPAARILREAARVGAALVVMGVRRHDVIDRALGDETTLSVMRGAPCPVLGVAPTLRGVPRHAVVGVDFGRASRRAAFAALDVLAPGGKLVLAYVDAPRQVVPEDGEGPSAVHDLGVDAAFKRLVGELSSANPGVTIEPVVLECLPGVGTARELLALADRSGADLLAVGSQRHGRVDRWLLGSVTSALVRDGRHSVLVVPPKA